MTSIAPRLSHNVKLSKEFTERHQIPPQVPAVSAQLETVEINRRALMPFGYNPSLIRYNNRLFMAYRYHHSNTWETSLAMAELNDKFDVIENRKIELPGPSNEDPRLFLHEGGMWIAYVNSHGGSPTTMPVCSMRYGQLIEGKTWFVDGQYLIKYGKNESGGMEKNWCPLSNRVKYPWFIYTSSPEQIVINVSGTQATSEHKSPQPKWRWGQIKGGTTPLPYKDKLIRFFHSRLDNESPPHRHRYYMGAIVMEPEPPFAVISVSQRPLLRGSHVDSMTKTEKSTCRHWKANCVLPFGAIEMNGDFFVSVGINDSHNAIVRVKPEQL